MTAVTSVDALQAGAQLPAVVAVACSGGRDSLALLHATLRAAAPLGLQVAALHVHHGLQAQADDWAASLARRCRRWRQAGHALSFHLARLDSAPPPGASVEAWARRERYRALARLAREAGADLVLLAHHRDDQAETVLLQALRGAGPAGLSAMPARITREGITWARPWLQREGADIAAWVARHRLKVADDPSNLDPRYARNRLRHQVMPVWRAAFPEAPAALAAVAAHAQEARAVLDEVAAADLLALGAAAPGAPLPHAAWSALSLPRRRLVLRHWLARAGGRGPSEALVDRVLHEWQGRGALQVWQAGGPAGGQAGGQATLRASGGLLRRVPLEIEAATSPLLDGPGLQGLTMPARDGALVELPGWRGVLRLRRVEAGGLPREALAGLEARPRAGGEQFLCRPGGTARSLKKQYQAQGVPVWERGGPLLWRRGRLLFVPGLGVDARAWGPPGASQWLPQWCPRA